MIIAELYRGSGRPTGHHWEADEAEWDRLTAENPYHNYVQFETQEAFEAAFIAGEHYQCHEPARPGNDCPHCREAGWVAND